MAGIDGYDCEGTLVINGVSFNNQAWACVSDDRGEGGLLQLLGTQAERKGGDREIPHGIGVIAYPRRRKGTRYDLHMLICGDMEPDGTPRADANVGIVENLLLLEAIIDAVSNTPAGLQSATLTVGSRTLIADIHTLAIIIESAVRQTHTNQALIEATLQISIPTGKFVLL